MKTVTWIPDLAQDAILIAVQTSAPQMTEHAWLQALADRVQKMVLASPDPTKALQWAVRELNRDGLQSVSAGFPPSRAGEALVLANSLLRLEMQRLRQREWPMPVNEDSIDPEPTMEWLESLDMWVEAASAATRPS
ncbi:MAG: hypothetical protein HYU74_03140 [Dechloromonas sp.]|nr:hypothetical protein [Dechloromonas sp.]